MIRLAGNLLSILSSSMEAYERNIKTYDKSIRFGVIRYVVQAFAYLLLGGINGVIITIMAIIRHLFMYRKKFTGKVIVIWIIISAALNLYFASTLTDLFPFIATIQFTIMVRKQNILALKWAQIINSAIWVVYQIAIGAYIYMIFDIILIIITLIRLQKGVEE